MTATEDKIFELESKLERSRLKVHDLATMGTLIASILDIEKILSVVMEMAIRTVEGEVGLIQLHENDELKSKVTWGIDDTIIKNIIYQDNQDISEYCFSKQDSVIYNECKDNDNIGPNISSVLAVPIKSRARCHGTVIIINKSGDDYFNEHDRENLEILVNFAAVAIDNSILLEESLVKQKIEQELSIAKQVQNTILPEDKTDIEGVELGTLYRPAKEVGGDFYDIIRLSTYEFLILIADVSNKGVPAALVMSATAAIIKSELQHNPQISPAHLMSSLNDLLCGGIIKSHEMFVTLFIARFNLRDNKVIYCNAGHVPPLYWQADENTVIELRTGGTFVGQFPEIEYVEGERPINRGDRLFAFTDGLTEAEDISGNFFGIDRVRQVFEAQKGLPADQFCHVVKEWVDRFREGAGDETLDDFTLLKIKIT
jgi:sigma-B regulation protein RsbU (phosphoserine phosphatase)